MFNERLIDTLKELIFYVKQIANGGGGGGSDDGGSDGGSVQAPLVVIGAENDGGGFAPAEGQPTWGEAREAFISGRPVFLNLVEDGEEDSSFLSIIEYTIDTLSPALIAGDNGIAWLKPDEDQEDDSNQS